MNVEDPALQGLPRLQEVKAEAKRAAEAEALINADYNLDGPEPPAATQTPSTTGHPLKAPVVEANKPSEASNAQTPTAEAAQQAHKRTPILVLASNPSSYTVKRGDTLWDISARFLKQPWRWPEIWKGNPKIKDPHRIYPGDRITLRYVNGAPGLYLDRPGIEGDAELKQVKLSPRVRYQSRAHVIPMLQTEALIQYMQQPKVVTEADIQRAAYVLGTPENRVISATGHTIYVQNLPDSDSPFFSLYRPSGALRHPETRESLGQELKYLGNAYLDQPGNPSTLQIVDAKFEILEGDLLLPSTTVKSLENLVPQRMKHKVNGQIVSLFNAITQAIRHQIVAIDLGQGSGVRPGDVLKIFRQGQSVVDPRHKDKGKPRMITMPTLDTGTLMVLETFDKVSYALIVDASNTIRVGDNIRSY